jgi:hypothetical protein
MSIPQWSPRIELLETEELIVSRLKRTGKLFVFLRQFRHELFDESFQQELEEMYSDAPYGTAPKPPAMLAMVTLLQAYQQSSDAAAVEHALLDRRSLNLHQAESLLQDLRRLRQTPGGREKLRERGAVEHSLAHICARQGRRARYIGTRKNTLDVRRTAVVENLHCLQRMAA